MTHRVTAMKGDSTDQLAELIRRGETFDFIYVDGSHTCLDCYADIIMAWQLLRRGGVLAVDDVLYHQDKVLMGDLLGYPLKAKEHFMRKFMDEFDVISDSYRLFVRKR
jgi:predicted O-methyltransferase YrrM